MSDNRGYQPTPRRTYRLAGPREMANPASMPGGHVDDLAAAYALGALEEAEHAAVDAHMRVCPDCERAVADALDTAGMLVYLAPQAQPSVASKAALFARVAHAQRAVAATPLPMTSMEAFRTPTLPPSTAQDDLVLPVGVPAAGGNAAQPRRQSRTGWIISAISAPLLIALVVTGMWGLQLRDQLSTQTGQLADLQSELTNFGSGTTSYQLSPGEAAPQAEGQIVMGADQRAGMLQVDINSKEAAGTYQLLMVSEDGSLVPVSEFTVGQDGKGQAQFETDQPFSEYESFHIQAKPLDASAPAEGFDVLFQDNGGSLGSTGSGLDVGP
ncbi:MAG: zf-HC2 domain-containing protein [Chloroflexota bacterium]|nr:zf-HC2 domain-containing protein [Chloroflexota bacterium]